MDQKKGTNFFIGGCDWYVAEYDGDDLFFGYAILNNDTECAEWGYVSFRELKEGSVHGIEVDCELEEFRRCRPVYRLVASVGRIGFGYQGSEEAACTQPCRLFILQSDYHPNSAG